MRSAKNLLGDEMMALLPAALHHCLTEPKWEDELQGLHVVRALTVLALPADCDGYRLVDNPPSPRWDWQGHALVHQSSLLHTGVPVWIEPPSPVRLIVWMVERSSTSFPIPLSSMSGGIVTIT